MHNFVAKGETEKEVLEKVKEHMMKAHPDTEGKSEDEMMEMVKKDIMDE